MTLGIPQTKKIDSRTTKPRAEKVPRDFNSDLQAKFEGREKTIPLRYRKLFSKSVRGLVSSKTAIRAFCQSCVGYEDLPESVAACTAQLCPLYNLRPYQGKK